MQDTQKIAAKKERLTQLVERLVGEIEPEEVLKYVENSFHAFFISHYVEGLDARQRDEVLRYYLTLKEFVTDLEEISKNV